MTEAVKLVKLNSWPASKLSECCLKVLVVDIGKFVLKILGMTNIG